jgi:hypothetical protein
MFWLAVFVVVGVVQALAATWGIDHKEVNRMMEEHRREQADKTGRG